MRGFKRVNCKPLASWLHHSLHSMAQKQQGQRPPMAALRARDKRYPHSPSLIVLPSLAGLSAGYNGDFLDLGIII